MSAVDQDAPQEQASGASVASGDGRFERLDALLIGLIAIVAAMLVVLQTSAGLDEARGNAIARRLASELTTRIIVSGSLAGYAGVNAQRALLVSMEGNARALVALQAGDAPSQRIGEATVTAGERLTDLALAMGRAPDATSPLDPYARDVLGTTSDQLFAILAEQNGAADAAHAASDRSSRAVLGLSVIALSGVLAGLAAVVGAGRAGRALLALAWVSAIAAVGLLLVARGILVL